MKEKPPDATESEVILRRSHAPRIPLFDEELSDPTIAERVDELLEGFGE